MYFNDNAKWIFIHIPKTGGTTIKKCFYGRPHHAPLLDDRFGRHRSVIHIPPEYRNKNRNYFKFTIVRNPWDRLLSYYSFLCQCAIQGKEKHEIDAWRINGFKHWLMNDQFYPTWAAPPQPYEQIRNQLDFITNEQNEIEIDYIIRFEDYEEDLIKMRFYVEMHEANPISIHNPSVHKDYRLVYDDEMIEFVAHHHKRDIDYFDYSF